MYRTAHCLIVLGFVTPYQLYLSVEMFIASSQRIQGHGLKLNGLLPSVIGSIVLLAVGHARLAEPSPGRLIEGRTHGVSFCND